MNDIPYLTSSKGAPDCLNCVHSNYEEAVEEFEVLICFLRRKLIKKLDQAADCMDYYTGANE